MGYTHYYTPSANLPTQKQLDIVKYIIDNSEIPLGDYAGNIGSKPEVLTEGFRFKGVRDLGNYETFSFVYGSNKWNFCKTARKPYDALVVTLLQLLSKFGLCEWDSDGYEDEDDFDDVLIYINDVLGTDDKLLSLLKEEELSISDLHPTPSR